MKLNELEKKLLRKFIEESPVIKNGESAFGTKDVCSWFPEEDPQALLEAIHALKHDGKIVDAKHFARAYTITETGRYYFRNHPDE